MKIAEIIQQLQQPVPRELIKQKQVGDSILDFLSWYDTCNLLDQRVGLGCWSWEIVTMSISHNHLFLSGKLTIYGDDGSRSMMATGSEKLNCNSYGDPSSNSEAMCLKRCCSKFGLGRSLYQREEKRKRIKTTKPKNPNPYRTGSREISREEWLQLRNK